MANSGSRFVVSRIDRARTDPDDGYARWTVRVVRTADFASFDEAEAEPTNSAPRCGRRATVSGDRDRDR